MLRAIAYTLVGAAIFMMVTGILGLLWGLLMYSAALLILVIVSIVMAQDAREIRRINDLNKMTQEEYENVLNSNTGSSK